jgi:hypothetical protein
MQLKLIRVMLRRVSDFLLIELRKRSYQFSQLR